MHIMTDMSSLNTTFASTYPTSGQPPTKKRRRPALSCEQCRKRKIKCDRNYPCNHCIQSKSATCTYSADNAAVFASNPTVNSINNSQTTYPSRPKKTPSSISSHLSTDTTSPGTTARGTNSVKSSLYTPTDTDDEGLSRQALLDRIRSLENKLAIPSEQSKQSEQSEENEFMEVNSLDLFCKPFENQDLAAPDTFEGKSLRGTVSKTRFFGQSHWMYSYGAFERIACLTVDPKTSAVDFQKQLLNNQDIGEIKNTLDQCKAIARAAKAGPHKKYLQNQNYRDSIPPRAMADKLVNLYFRTSESVHRILHVPTFEGEYRQYWENTKVASTVFVIKLMLVMSIGACFYQGPNSENYHDQAAQWIFAAQSWLSTPFEKGRLHISGVQIHCLVLVARLDNAVAGDLIWISAGALFRIAFQMGFHRDPKYLPPMSQLHSEIRRRLWATIIELNVQSALDSGMPPLISLDDWDTEPPANIDDIDIDEKSKNRAVSKPPEIYTQTSIQLLLGKSLQARIQVIKNSNTVRRDPTYDEALAVGKELSQALKENNTFVNRINSTSSPRPISQLDRNLLDLSVRRFLIPVHRPFAAQSDPRYYFSRKVCLDCSMTILSYPSSDSNNDIASPGYRDDYTWLKTMSGGFQKGFIVHAAMIIFNELLTQVDEDDGSSTTSTAATREPLKQTLRDIIALAAERIKLVENNVKGHLFISIVLAQVEALEKGESVEQAVIGAAKASLAICLDLLKERIRKSLTVEEYAAIVDRNAPNPLVHGEETDGGIEAPRNAKGILSSDGPMPGVPSTSNGMFGSGAVFNFGSGMGTGDPEWGAEFGMQDWNTTGSGVDVDFTMPDSWLLSGWEDGGIF